MYTFVVVIHMSRPQASSPPKEKGTIIRLTDVRC